VYPMACPQKAKRAARLSDGTLLEPIIFLSGKEKTVFGGASPPRQALHANHANTELAPLINGPNRLKAKRLTYSPVIS